MSVFDWKAGLNDQQRQAVEAIIGPVLVVAGAGSGKTRVIEHRVHHLLQRGIAPEKILLLSFTRRASREMLLRAAARDPRAARVAGGTFHSVAHAWLRRHCSAAGLRPNFTILDPGDASTAIGKCIVRIGAGQSTTRFPTGATLRDVFSKAVNCDRPVAEVLACDFPHYAHHEEAVLKVLEEYQRFKTMHGLVDYDDLLVRFLQALSRSAARPGGYQFIMCDEHQDANRLQGQIALLLAGPNNNLLVVGDDAQAIYSFRGGYRRNLLGFANQFPTLPVPMITLEQNYRSTQPILDVANALLENMSDRISKRLQAAGSNMALPERPRLLRFSDEQIEAQWVASSILRAREDGTPLEKQAALYRNGHMSSALQIALASLHIPFRVFGGMKLTDTAHVKDVLSLLRILCNPADELAWSRWLELYEGIGPRVSESISSAAATAATVTLPEAIHGAKAAASNRSVKIRRAVDHLIGVLENLQALPVTAVAEQFASALDAYRPLAERVYDDHHRRWEDLESLWHSSAKYSRLQDLLADLSLEPPAGSRHARPSPGDDERPLTLSTIHSAKGAEWDHVYVLGLCDGLLPCSRALESEDGFEEEARLLYVAVTRAKRELILSMRAGHGGLFDQLCRFLDAPNVLRLLDQRPPEVLDGDEVQRQGESKPNVSGVGQVSLTPSDPMSIRDNPFATCDRD